MHLPELFPQVLLESVVSAIACRTLLAIAMRALKRTPRLLALVKPSAQPLEVAALLIPATLLLPPAYANVPEAALLLRIAVMVRTLVLCWVALSAVLTVIFEGYFRKLRGVHIPVVIKTILRTLSLAAMILGVLHFHFGVDVSGAAITAASVSIVLGVALKDTLGSLFSGIALSMEGPFQVGDYIQVGEWTGYVVDTNWRTTQLQNKHNDVVTIPNNRIADAPIINYYRPDKRHRTKLEFEVDTQAPPFQVHAVLEQAALSCREVLREPAPLARAVRVKEGAVVYSLNYYIQDFDRNATIQNEVISLAWYGLRRRGHSFALGPVGAAAAAARSAEAHSHQEVEASLRRFPIFQALAPEQLREIASRSKVELWGRGEVIFRQGDAGDSYYVIRSGSVELLISKGDPDVTASRFVATLPAGAGFGERSLLTGEPRSATVRAAEDAELFVIDKAAFQGILMNDNATVEKLSHALADIQERDRRRKNEPGSTDAQMAETRKNLFSRISSFFQLGAN